MITATRDERKKKTTNQTKADPCSAAQLRLVDLNCCQFFSDDALWWCQTTGLRHESLNNVYKAILLILNLFVIGYDDSELSHKIKHKNILYCILNAISLVTSSERKTLNFLTLKRQETSVCLKALSSDLPFFFPLSCFSSPPQLILCLFARRHSSVPLRINTDQIFSPQPTALCLYYWHCVGVLQRTDVCALHSSLSLFLAHSLLLWGWLSLCFSAVLTMWLLLLGMSPLEWH